MKLKFVRQIVCHDFCTVKGESFFAVLPPCTIMQHEISAVEILLIENSTVM